MRARRPTGSDRRPFPRTMATVEEAVRDMRELRASGRRATSPSAWAVEIRCSGRPSPTYPERFPPVISIRCFPPSGTPGLRHRPKCAHQRTGISQRYARPVKISTGPLSQHAPDAVIPVETAIAMVKEMGGNALKLFPIHGLQCREELLAVAKACAKEHFILEPTGGIRLENFEELMRLLLDIGVPKIIPHVYSSIIDPATNQTRVDDVKEHVTHHPPPVVIQVHPLSLDKRCTRSGKADLPSALLFHLQMTKRNISSMLKGCSRGFFLLFQICCAAASRSGGGSSAVLRSCIFCGPPTFAALPPRGRSSCLRSSSVPPSDKKTPGYRKQYRAHPTSSSNWVNSIYHIHCGESVLR